MQKLMVLPIQEGKDADLNLIERIKEGEEEALKVLMEKKIDKLLSFCTRMLGDREEAKDLCQMVFLRIWEQADKFDSSYSLNTWIYRIAYNLCIDNIRHKKSVDAMQQRFLQVVKEKEEFPSPHKDLQEEEIERILIELSENLSPKQKTVFLLHEIEEVSTPEIAKILKCNQATVRNHLFHARRIISEKLKEKYPEYLNGRL